MTPDRDLIRLHNLRKRLWDRIRGGADDPELAALILAMQEVTDRIIYARTTGAGRTTHG
jgi:hypothetical protein